MIEIFKYEGFKKGVYSPFGRVKNSTLENKIREEVTFGILKLS